MAVLSRRERTLETRRANETALLRAAVELLDEGASFAGLGIEQIVKRAGLSRPTFYAYFEDKRALVLRLGELVEHDLAQAADPWLAGAGVPMRDTLAAVLAVFRAHRAALGAVVESATYDDDVAAFWRAFHDRFLPGAQRRIAEAYPDMGDDAVAARAYALVWMTERTLVEHVMRPTVDEQALLDQLTWVWRMAATRA
ncbi:MAG TPA: helix-turn-helix domain-containing protein [Baekduia sp.]|nr:helix-turn-helix domain-containing protein [Baekduia sp.]